MDPKATICVAGSDTMIGAALVAELRDQGYGNFVGTGRNAPDFTDPQQVRHFFAEHRPDYVFVAAGKSGGIQFNLDQGADLMQDNLGVALSILPSANEFNVKKLLYLGSSCMYPRECSQPMREDDLLTGPLEPTNEPYALAKLAALKLCQSFRAQHGANFVFAIPTNVFGPGDRFDAKNSHVVAALVKRMDDTKRTGADHIDIWGTGAPRREFIPVADLARGAVHVMRHYDAASPINIGTGHALSIADLAIAIKRVVGFAGELRFDTTKPDGMPEKVLDNTKLATLGWSPVEDFDDALAQTYESYLKQMAVSRGDADEQREPAQLAS